MVSRRMARRALITSMAGAALTGGSARAAQTPADETADPLGYVDAASRLSVATYVNGQGPFAFLVDTGATTSVITSDIADRLGLERGALGRLHSIAGAQPVPMARVASLAVGKRERKNMTVAVLPRAQLRMDGILGLEWLGQASLLLDFGRRRMVVGEALPVPDEATVIVKSKLVRSGLILIDALIPRERVIAFIDSGSTTTAGNLALLDAARAGGALVGGAGPKELISVTGQVLNGRSAVLTRLTLGPMTLRNLPLVIGSIHTFEYWGLQDRPAIVIGTDVLRTFDKVSIDLRRNEVRFRLRS
ncbi:aspartyl protease [Caulobacter segnis]|uniref:Peptidase A2A, retrovirus RVP subgroup n=2 Tax=Caulobacter segnis TaxID=88688 RepID=D5VLL9_CAUST|nr:retropepsin-like aspartic protease [Caulobacter segnis]ADG11392.1 Peptidase A2A, retrovirus RVP subgroup [Caulobacter segnis ATCC 21756]AVQ03060.1 aspartyl protease [Caulobacter segnis]